MIEEKSENDSVEEPSDPTAGRLYKRIGFVEYDGLDTIEEACRGLRDDTILVHQEGGRGWAICVPTEVDDE